MKPFARIKSYDTFFFPNAGACAMCGKQVLDTKFYKQSNVWYDAFSFRCLSLKKPGHSCCNLQSVSLTFNVKRINSDDLFLYETNLSILLCPLECTSIRSLLNTNLYFCTVVIFFFLQKIFLNSLANADISCSSFPQSLQFLRCLPYFL